MSISGRQVRRNLRSKPSEDINDFNADEVDTGEFAWHRQHTLVAYRLGIGLRFIVTQREFKIVDILWKSLSIYRKNFACFTLLAVVANLPSIHFIQENAAQLRAGELPSPQLWASLSGVLSTSLLGAALSYGTIMEMRGRRAGIMQCVRAGLMRAVPVLAVALLVGMAAGLPTLVLNLPGVIIGIFVMIMLYVAIPVAVVEQSGVLSSLARSRELTSGFRLPIFGLLMLLGAIALVVGMSIQELLQAGPEGELLYVGGVFATQVVVAIVSAVMAAVCYNELRRIKESVSLDALATAQVVSDR